MQLFTPLLHAPEKFIHASVRFLRAVDGEGDLRDVANAHAVADFRAYERPGGHEALQGGLFFLLRPGYGDKHSAAFATWSEDDLGDVAGCDARVGEFALQHGGDLFGEGVDDTSRGGTFWLFVLAYLSMTHQDSTEGSWLDVT